MIIRPAATAALTLTAVLALAGCAGTASPGSSDMPGIHLGSSTSPAPTAEANEADMIFAGMMIEHHTQAVEMSEMILAKDGVDPRVTELAEQIKAAQQPEIEQMRRWLEDWNVSTSAMDGMHHGGGMMTDDDMQALETTTGPDASRLFLEQMIKHHQGAIQMAQDEAANGQSPDAIDLAETIIETQTTEITTMEEILATL